MQERSSLWLAGLALLCVVPTTATAQTVPSPYRFIETSQEVGVFTGFHSPGSGQFGLSQGGGAVVGARYGVEATGPLAIEGVATYTKGNRRVVAPTLPESQSVLGEVPEEVFFLDLRLRMSLTGRRTWHGLTPHILFGVGLALGMRGTQSLDAQLPPEDRFLFGTKFTPSLGGGVRYHVGGPWTLRADGVLNLYRIANPSGFRDPDRGFEGVSEREWVNDKGLSLGLSYLF